MKEIILTKEEIYEIEKLTTEKYGISNLILMENAGRITADIVNEILREQGGKRKVIVFSGKGNNGGDGFVCARYLFNFDIDVDVYFIGEENKLKQISFTNLEILRKIGVEVVSIKEVNIEKIEIEKADVIVDGIFGIGLNSEVKGVEKQLIEEINKKKKLTVSIDIPSGLDANTGKILGKCINADVTVSFGFGKRGFYLNDGPGVTGEIKIVDIGFPKIFYRDG